MADIIIIIEFIANIIFIIMIIIMIIVSSSRVCWVQPGRAKRLNDYYHYHDNMYYHIW